MKKPCFLFLAFFVPYLLSISVSISARKLEVGMNLGSFSDYNPDVFFADAIKSSRTFYKTTTVDLNADDANKDANGWPTEDFKCAVFSGLKTGETHGTYKLYFNGQATLSGTGVTITGKTWDAAKNLTTANVQAVLGTVDFININFTSTKKLSTSAVGTGVTNIKLMRPDAPGSATAYDTTVVWNPQFLAAIAPFTTLRTLGTTLTNGGQTDTDWDAATVRPWSYATQNPSGSLTKKGKTPWEGVLQLANAANKDLWINIPHMATDAYIMNLLKLFKYGSDGNGNPYSSIQANPVVAPLKPTLKLYLEYSNEIWNTAAPYAPQTNYAKAQGALSPYCLFDNPDMTSVQSQVTVGYRYKAQRTVEFSVMARTVFGDAEMMTRIRPVLCWQQGYLYYSARTISFIDRIFNKLDTRSPYTGAPHPVSYYIYGGGGTGYWSAENLLTITEATMWTSDTFDPTTYYNLVRNDAAVTSSYGIKYLNYEGDMHYNPNNQVLLQATHWDARHELSTTQHLEKLSEVELELMNFLSLSTNKPLECDWAITKTINDYTQPQYKAIKNWSLMPAHSEVTLGRLIPFSTAGSANDNNNNNKWTTTTYSNTVPQTLTGNDTYYSVSYNFRVAATGSYKANVEYNCTSAAVMLLEVNGVPVVPQLSLAKGSSATAYYNFDCVPNKLYSFRIAVKSGGVQVKKVNFAINSISTSLENRSTNDLSFYNNKENQSAQIRTNFDNFTISVYDMYGKIVYQKNAQSYFTEFPTSSIQSGVYVVKINKGEESITRKVVL